jgi:hypothetical protein
MVAKSVIKIEKRVGDKTQSCFNPNSWLNQSDSKSPNITLQELLNISNAFVNNWNLEFNPKKSKF